MSKSEQRVADLDALIKAGRTDDPLWGETLLQELMELQVAVLTKKVPLTLEDWKARARAASMHVRLPASMAAVAR